ncbi:MDR family MFS transporter [Kocuria rhizophila]|uniref:MDR family MFS transporter n=1 Tax=Kocuria rhizophila TaxID=72000 RepID=UPI001DA7E795|nr:MDR family MFS transporter [Kocuria rhizophila]MCC5672498.1 multidrug efflux MFS transporter [Kocuria rhizophila]
MPASTPPPRDPAVPQGVTPTIVVLLVATFVVILNETVLNVALPHIMADLRVDAATVQWVTTSFMLTMAVVIPTTGFLLQRFGTRTVFALAMGTFSLGTLLAALSPGFWVLILARVVQAFGTAIMLPLLMTTILMVVPQRHRGVVMGNVSIVISVAPALGPTLSGVILQHFPWRSVFWFVLPIALLALAIGAARLRDVSERGSLTLDPTSVMLAVVGFGCVVQGLSTVGAAGSGDGAASGPWLTSRTGGLAVLAVGLVAVAAFGWRQVQLQRRDAPFLDLRTFGYRDFTVSVAVLALGMMTLFGGVIVLPLYLQTGKGLDTLETGLILLPGGLVMGLLGPVVGRLFDAHGPRPLAVPGGVLLVLVMLGFSRLQSETPVWWIVTLHVSMSVALALIFTPAFTAGLNPLPTHLYSHGSATLSTLQQVAGGAGTALLVGILQAGTVVTVRPDGSTVSDAVPGVHAAFLTATGVALAVLALTFFMHRGAPTELARVDGAQH